MNRKEEIKGAYKSLGKAHGIYDGMMLGTSVIGRFILKHVWRMTREDTLEYQARSFETIPADFKGSILEIPVGTGVISMPVWKTMPYADITCADYSPSMMETARQRAEQMGIKNITFEQADVGKMRFSDESFDAVVSLNGFHAFPDKDAAYSETFRVLKKGGIFTGCFYVKGEVAHTDKRIRQIYVKKGFFTPPFETVDSLRNRLETMYSKVEVTNVKSIAVFKCIK